MVGYSDVTVIGHRDKRSLSGVVRDLDSKELKGDYKRGIGVKMTLLNSFVAKGNRELQK